MMQNLEKEIEKAQRLVRTDSLQMSIGELCTMYEQNELIINPEFQRLFRWELEQKARLIESILLGIPVPSIFVFETENGGWELIDGLQRLSTIFEFIGILIDPDTGKARTPSSLIATRYLPSLSNVVWQKDKRIVDPTIKDQIELEKKFQLSIRRSRLNVQVLKRPSESSTKFELFQRLNAGGTQANAQELRNSMVIMLDPKLNAKMKEMAGVRSFQEIIDVNPEAREKQKHMEYVSRFLVYTYVDYDGKLDIEEYVDEGMRTIVNSFEFERLVDDFTDTFDFLFAACGGGALKKIVNGRPTLRVTYTTFELIAIGVAKNIEALRLLEPNRRNDFIRTRVQSLWDQKIPEGTVYSGMRGTTRIAKTLALGKKWFSEDAA